MGSLFKLAKQIVGGKIGRKAAKLVHYLIIYHVGDLFPVDNVLRWGYISSGQTNKKLNQIIAVCTCTLPRVRMIGFYIPPDLGSVLYTYTYTCIPAYMHTAYDHSENLIYRTSSIPSLESCSTTVRRR